MRLLVGAFIIVGLLALSGCGAENGRDLAGVNVRPEINCVGKAQSATTVTVGDITVDCGTRPEVIPPVVVTNPVP